MKYFARLSFSEAKSLFEEIGGFFFLNFNMWFYGTQKVFIENAFMVGKAASVAAENIDEKVNISHSIRMGDEYSEINFRTQNSGSEIKIKFISGNPDGGEEGEKNIVIWVDGESNIITIIKEILEKSKKTEVQIEN